MLFVSGRGVVGGEMSWGGSLRGASDGEHWGRGNVARDRWLVFGQGEEGIGKGGNFEVVLLFTDIWFGSYRIFENSYPITLDWWTIDCMERRSQSLWRWIAEGGPSSSEIENVVTVNMGEELLPTSNVCCYDEATIAVSVRLPFPAYGKQEVVVSCELLDRLRIRIRH
ncbi:hypothetical protein Tco_0692954 [Tanacetum coccineum]